MKKKTVLIAVLVVLVVLFFTQQGNSKNTKGRVELWNYYASKETPCYLAELGSENLWLVKFEQKLKPFKPNEFVSNYWLGETTYTNAKGVKSVFYFFEIEVNGVVFPIAVLASDLNRIIA